MATDDQDIAAQVRKVLAAYDAQEVTWQVALGHIARITGYTWEPVIDMGYLALSAEAQAAVDTAAAFSEFHHPTASEGAPR